MGISKRLLGKAWYPAMVVVPIPKGMDMAVAGRLAIQTDIAMMKIIKEVKKNDRRL